MNYVEICEKYRHGRLQGENLRYANLRYANLHDADLSGANLSGANLSDANLSGVKGLPSASRNSDALD